MKQKKTRVAKVSPEAMAVLVRHRWPGNVRELENVIYRSAVIAQGDAILVKDLPLEIRDAVGVPAEPAVTLPADLPAEMPRRLVEPQPSLTLERALDYVFEQLKTGDEGMLARVEREFVVRALAADGGDQTKTAKRLGLTKVVVQKRAKEHASAAK